MFRTAAASFAAAYGRDYPHLASAVLGHIDPRVTEEHYNRASSVSANEIYVEILSSFLALLCHKFWCPFRAAQHGQRESVVARAATNLRRIVAIEFGTWRSGRNGGSSGLVTFA